SIAWSVVEHLHGAGSHGPKTLFATHYHELTQLAESLPRLRNFSVAVKEWNDEIIFVRQVTPGASERSFGIQVARLAGLPDSVVGRAKEILAGLETGSRNARRKTCEMEASKTFPPPSEQEIPGEETMIVPSQPKVRKSAKSDPSQLELF
ncbi:MAG: hypothetical protein VX839_00065, partial [Verrucomicrobiota bacterium]|nr:hypothetical protein [Verrucomicrobiota bacterium]